MAQLNPLQVRLIELDDVDLVPAHVLEQYESSPRLARVALASHVPLEPDLERRARQQALADDASLWQVARPPTSEPSGNDTAFASMNRTVTRKRNWTPTLVGVGALGLVGAAVGSGAYDMWQADVVIYNGFQRVIEVHAEGERWEILPQRHIDIDLPPRDVAVQARFVGNVEPIEDITLPLGGHHFDRTVYNVAGRAVLYMETAVYKAVQVPGDEGPAPELLAGRTHFVSDPHYLFQVPPGTLRLKHRETRTALRAIPFDPPEAAMGYLFGNGYPDEGAMMAHALDLDGVDSPWVLRVVMQDLERQGADANTVCRSWLEEQPLAVERHRFCQDQRRFDHLEDLVAEYRALAAANPESALHTYLLGRMLEGDEALHTYERALALDDSFTRGHAAVGITLMETYGDLDRAQHHLDVAVSQDPRLQDQLSVARIVVRQLRGVPAGAIADEMGGDPSVFSRQAMLRLEADPDSVVALREQLHVELPANGASPEEAANVFANVALIVGDLDALRTANAEGGGLEVYLALSDGATAEDRAWQMPLEQLGDHSHDLYGFLQAELGGEDPTPYLASLSSFDPALVSFLQTQTTPSFDQVRQALEGARVGLHAPVWFIAYRRTSDRAFAEQARRWSLGSHRPYLEHVTARPR